MTKRRAFFLVLLLYAGILLVIGEGVIHAIGNDQPDQSINQTAEDQQGIIPEVLEIPSIHVNAHVESIGLDPTQKRMGNPVDTRDVGWYALGFLPGQNGSA